jgi:hypothetical protein
LVPYALVLQASQLGYPSASFAHFDPQVTRIAAAVKEPNYWRIDGKPVLFLYDVLDSTSFPLAKWQQLKDAIGEPVFAVSAIHNASSVTYASLQGETSYGPNPGLPSSPQTRGSYQLGLSEDSAGWGALPGTFSCVSLNPTQDRRPLGPTAYRDRPTMPEWIRAVRKASSFYQAGVGYPKLGTIYSHSEIAEGGGFNNIQEVSPTTGRSWMIDGFAYATKNAAPPASYQYEVSGSNVGAYIVRTGTWTTEGPTAGAANDGSQLDGAHDSDEDTSSTTNDTHTFSHERVSLLTLYTTTGPDRGIAAISVDGGAETMVDLYAAVQTRHAAAWTSGALDGSATHTVSVRATGTKNGASVGVKVGVDSYGVTFNPRAV